jgi:hypothetical protein
VSRRFGRRARNVVLTIHIVVSVGLLGDSAGFLAVAIRRAMSDDAAFADASLDLLGTFALFFGIPLSFLALLTGIALGLGTPWGVFRHPWVINQTGSHGDGHRRRCDHPAPRAHRRRQPRIGAAHPRRRLRRRRPHRRHRARRVQAGAGAPRNAATAT